MSKIYKKYLQLKSNSNYEKNTLYLFKSGIFFIFIDNDAKLASNLLNLKLGKLNDTVVKCGFPCQSLEKYTSLLKSTPYKLEIVSLDASEQILKVNEYNYNEKIQYIIDDIINLDIDTLSISQIYNYLYDIQKKLKDI